ncbi:hypothetical protein [Paracoccus indicus]|uniref:hypothetical protein n=1 Tax=Paracoccus indicus TaxID=2079229 RepID=UPI000D361FD6|nr:hypothetical protein [Paracoccus indicus]
MLWADLATAVGMLLLACPVIRLNKSKRLLYQLRTLHPEDTLDAIGQKMAAIAEQKMLDQIADWRSWHQLCLFGGYGLLAASSLARLYSHM